MEITKNSFYTMSYGKIITINYDPSLKYKQLLCSFKTIFPKSVLTNQ